MTNKQQIVVQIYNTLQSSGTFDDPEVQEERNAACKALNDLWMNIDSPEHEYAAHIALLHGLKRKYESIESKKAGYVDRLAQILFASDSIRAEDIRA